MTENDALASGRQYEIRCGDHQAVVTGVGATLRVCRLQGREVIRSFPARGASPAGHGQVLAPWPNRLRGGRYEWEGRHLQLPLSEPARGNAIHGLVRWQEWAPREVEADRVGLWHRIHPRDGYPYTVDVEVTYTLSEGGLTVAARATNPGGPAAPFGIGFHPYLLGGDGGIDAWSLRVPARTRLEVDGSGIPVASRPVEGTDRDLRAGRPIADLVLDDAFTDLVRGADGRAVATVGATSLWVDETFPFLMVFTGDTLGADLRRRAVAVEPMTCPPNALATGEHLVVLSPGGGWEGRWGITAV